MSPRAQPARSSASSRTGTIASVKLVAAEVGPELLVQPQGLDGVREARLQPLQGAAVEDGGRRRRHLAEVGVPGGRGATKGQAGDARGHTVLLQAAAVPIAEALVGALEGAQDAAGEGESPLAELLADDLGEVAAV